MKKSILVLLALAIVAVIAGCKDPIVQKPVDIVGTWTLATVSGVPASTAGMSGTMTINSDSTYSSMTNLSSAAETGTWALSGSTYTFTPTDTSVSPYTGTISGSMLMIDVPSFVTFGYSKN